MTLAIQSSKISSSLYTFPIVIGLKNESHEEMEKKFLEELLCLQLGDQKFYYGGNVKEMRRICVVLIAILKDQIARRGSSCIALGGDKYSVKWRYGGDL